MLLLGKLKPEDLEVADGVPAPWVYFFQQQRRVKNKTFELFAFKQRTPNM